MATTFARSPKRDDPNGHMTVQANLDQLRDAFDASVGKFKQGTSTVTSANTSLVVTHGLGAATHQVMLTPLVDPAGRWWVSNKTATQFQINLQVAAPVGGIQFDWVVKGA